MQKVKLPLTIDALRAAQRRLDYVGFYPKKLVERIGQSVVSVDSDVDVELSFSIDNQRLTVITGKAEVNVTLMCQRCNNNFEHSVHIDYCFCPVVDDEKAKTLPEDYEPIAVNEFGEVDLLAMVEDEVILSLPVVPMHEYEHCEVSCADKTFGELPEEEEKPNPFAVLAALKNK